jgi:ribosome-associated protein
MAKTKTDKASASKKAARPRKVGVPVGSTIAGTASTPKAKTPKLPKLPKGVASAIRAARDRKAVDIVVLDLRKAGGFTDYFVICTGTNPRQIHAIADAVNATLRSDLGEKPALAEGANRSEWILLDYFDFVVHVFSRECRTFYDLERLWGNAERFPIADES